MVKIGYILCRGLIKTYNFFLWKKFFLYFKEIFPELTHSFDKKHLQNTQALQYSTKKERRMERGKEEEGET